MAVFALSACATTPVVSTDPVAACSQQAQRTPELRAIREKQLATYYSAYLYERDYKQLLNQKIDQCLAAQGLTRPGGVETVRHD